MKIFGFEIKPLKTPKKETTKFTGKENKSTGKIMQLDKDLIDRIVGAFKDQSRKDIQKWRTAIKMAKHPEKPRMNYLHDLYDDLATDGHFKAQIRLRKYTTLNTAFSVKNANGETNEDASRFLNRSWFYDFIGYALDAVFYGYTLVELSEFHEKNVKLGIVPRRNVVPSKKVVIPDLTKQIELDYTDEYFKDWLIEIGATDDLGIVNDIIPNLIWKRNVAQSWAEFCEKFGIPMITATTNAYDTKDIDKIEYMLQQIGEASTGVFPIGTTVDIKEANRTDAYQSYANFINYNREEISVAIVGGTMITNDGASRSQSEVHERNLDQKIAVADKRDITFLINDVLIPLLIRQGYSVFKEGDEFEFTQSHNLPLDKFWTITQGVMTEHDVDEEWLSKTFFIPITGKKKSPTLKDVTAMHNDLQTYGFHYPDYPVEQCCDKHDVYAVRKPFAKRMQDLHDKLAKEVWENKDTLSSAAQITVTESLEFIKGLYQGWGNNRIEADWNAPDHLAMQMMEYNLFEFSANKTEARLASMSQLLIDKEKLQIRSFADFKTEVDKLKVQFNENWLRTEYNLSVATGQTSAQYLRFMSEKDSVTSFVQYQTAGDNKVRTEHQLLDGKIFNLSDPSARNLLPPLAYGCRCEWIQYLGKTAGKVVSGSSVKALLPEKFHGSQFDVNRAELHKIFTKKQFYTKGLGSVDKLNDINYTNFGLKAWSKIKNKLSSLKLDTSITGANVKELFVKTAKEGTAHFMGFEDYLKRKIILKEKVFDFHTKGHYLGKTQLRHQLFPFVNEVLQSPDEVWLYEHNRGKNKFKSRYIKFFKDRAIVVECEVKSNHLEVITWYNLKDQETKIRKGLLINNRPFKSEK